MTPLSRRILKFLGFEIKPKPPATEWKVEAKEPVVIYDKTSLNVAAGILDEEAKKTKTLG